MMIKYHDHTANNHDVGHTMYTCKGSIQSFNSGKSAVKRCAKDL